jgi:hypothetical protein
MMTDQERQAVLDEEHLKLLRIGYVVAGVADGFFALFPLVYVLIGIVFAAAVPAGAGGPGEPNPAVFGLIFVVVGLVMSFVFAAQAALKLYTARALGRRQSRMLCMIAAGLSCLQMPWGTLLGVLTFLVLGRSSVKGMFEPSPAMLAAPPSRVATSLFDEEHVRRD